MLRAVVGALGLEFAREAAGPALAALTELTPEGGSDPAPVGGAGAAQLHEAIALLLEAASRERPVVVVIEDLHWIDGASLAAVQFSMRALTAGRLLFVLTYRGEDIGPRHPARPFLIEAERHRAAERWDEGTRDTSQRGHWYDKAEGKKHGPGLEADRSDSFDRSRTDARANAYNQGYESERNRVATTTRTCS
ncbi:AAA family ATPase [Microbacterium lacticum]